MKINHFGRTDIWLTLFDEGFKLCQYNYPNSVSWFPTEMGSNPEPSITATIPSYFKVYPTKESLTERLRRRQSRTLPVHQLADLAA